MNGRIAALVGVLLLSALAPHETNGVGRETALWLSLCPSKSYSGEPKRECSDRDRAEPRWGRTIDRAGFDARQRRATPS
jgi:hypothetical protein